MKKKFFLHLGFIFLGYLPATSQNVGIGISNPADKLHVYNGKIRLEDISYPWIAFVNNGIQQGFIGAEGANLRVGTWPGNINGDIFFRTNGVDRATITQSGNMGIGTTTPVAKLDVLGDARIENSASASISLVSGDQNTASIRVYKQSSGTSVGLLHFSHSLEHSLWSAYGGTVYLTGAGNLGIGNSTPDARLHIPSGQDVELGNTNNGFIMLGNYTGPNLVIDNNEIGYRNNGAWAELAIQNDGGSVRIGGVALPAGYRFGVDGKAICEELKVQLSGDWPDYVFSNNYSLKSFDELRDYITVNRHLPNIPAAAELEKNGLELGDMQKRMMEKIEELTLYVLQLEEKISLLTKERER
jgi:hypothetical protein